MWWTHKKAKKYWAKVHQQIQKTLKVNFKMKPEAMLLGITEDQSLKDRETLFLYMKTAARMFISAILESTRNSINRRMVDKTVGLDGNRQINNLNQR